jgi:AraC family transcriptional activator of pobA
LWYKKQQAMSATEPLRIKTIGEYHHLAGLSRPEHPLISVVNMADIRWVTMDPPVSKTLDFYTISLKRHNHNNFRYGQQQYNAQDGVMYFMAPGQVFGPPVRQEEPKQTTGWGLYIHPDFLWNTPLAKTIRRYEYFDYAVNEALVLTQKEEATMISIIQNIQAEYDANMDKFSQDIIISHIETLLNYSDRFYNRQFLSRKIENNQVLDKLEDLLNDYFGGKELLAYGSPSVQYVAEKLNISPNYLSGMLKTLTGRNTQQHIQDRMLEKAKQIISTTELTVSEISYELGFDHPQSFSRLFKAKTGLSPLEFRQTFN